MWAPALLSVSTTDLTRCFSFFPCARACVCVCVHTVIRSFEDAVKLGRLFNKEAIRLTCLID